MKRLLALTLTMIIAFTLAACSNNRNTTNSGERTQTEKKEIGSSDIGNKSDNKTQSNTATKKILVAYFSHSGNTQVIANQIHERVGGDIFEIKTVDPYPTDYNALADQAKREQQDNYRPKLATKVENMDSYDVIFIGYPNW